MKRIEVKPGDVYGEFTVIEEVPASGKRKFLCQCSCGRGVEVRLGNLRSGQTNSCGRCGLEHLGERKLMSEWADEKGIKRSTLRARLKRMGLGEALEQGKGR